MTKGEFLVIGRNRDGQAWLSTRRAFATRAEAEKYAAGIAECYCAEVVETLPVLVGRPGENNE